MIVAETWLGAALNRVWCAPKKGKRGNDFYLLCLTTESFTYFVGTSQHASSGFKVRARDAEYQCGEIDKTRREVLACRKFCEKKKIKQERCRLKRNESKYVFGFAIPCRANRRYVSPGTSTDQAWGTAE